MSFTLHKANARGHADHGWLNTYHTFSFGQFHDRNRMGFRSLRVINEDIVAPGAGFDTHPHKDMEIITYIIDGALAHKDSMGNGSVIKPGEIQKMSAGDGITHSEYNPSNDNSVHLLQIWIKPDTLGIPANYDQKTIDFGDGSTLVKLAGPEAANQRTVHLQQNAKIFAARPKAGTVIDYTLDAGRYGFVQIVKGEMQIGDQILSQGDGLEISDVQTLNFKALQESEFLFFDLA